MSRFHDRMTLGEARAILRELVDDGHPCPCCSQFAKVYRRKIHAGIARGLIAAYRHAGREWFHGPTVIQAGDSGEVSRLRYWGLVEEATERRDDGGRAGWWRVTDRGEAWVRGRATVPKYARIYDGRCLGLTGDPVTIRDALGSRFDYDELMAGV